MNPWDLFEDQNSEQDFGPSTAYAAPVPVAYDPEPLRAPAPSPTGRPWELYANSPEQVKTPDYPTPLPPEARALLRTIHGSESAYPGRDPYRVMYGGKEIDDFSDHPRIKWPIRSGPNVGNVTTAAGGYQFLGRSWDEAAKALDLPDFSPENQDRAAFWHAENTYRRKTGGRDLISDIGAAKDDPVKLDQIGRALSGWWTSLPGGIEPNPATRSFSARFSRQLAQAGDEGDIGPALYSMDRRRDDRDNPSIVQSINAINTPRAKPWERFQGQSEPPRAAKPWEQYQAVEDGVAPKRSWMDEASDFGRQLSGSIYEGTGSAVRGVGKAAQLLGEYTTEPLVEAITGKDYQTKNILNPAADYISGLGKRVKSGISEETQAEVRASAPSGDLFAPSTWSLGENPTLRGYAHQATNVFGQMVPVLLASYLSGAPAVGSGLAGAAQGGGAAVEESHRIIDDLARSGKLAEQSAYYRDLREKGLSHEDALASTHKKAEDIAFLLTAPVSGAGGAVTGALAHPATSIFGRSSLPVRALGRGAIGAAEEGTEEVAESFQTKSGINLGAGTSLSTTEGTFGDFLLGAIGGVGPATVGGIASKREEQAQPIAGAQPTVGADIPAGAVPADALLPTEAQEPSDDRQVGQGLPSEVGVRQEPIQAGAVEGTGAEAAQAGGILQTPLPGPTQAAADAAGQDVIAPIIAPGFSSGVMAQLQSPPQTPPVAPAEPIQPLPGRPVPTPSLQEILDDPRSADEIRADMEAAHNWQPSKDWQAVPRGVQLDPALETKTDGDVTFARLPPTHGTKAAPVVLETPQDVHVGAEITQKDPSPAQIESGIYQKRHLKFLGRDISIETEQGATRTAKDGSWSVPNMPAPYGQILGTKGADGDPLDITIGPNPKAKQGFIIDQINPDTGKFDELKTFGGFDSEAEARAAYVASFSDGKGEARIGAITAMPVAQFKAWLKGGNHEKALAYTPQAPVKQRTYKAKGPLNLLQFLAAEGGLAPDAGGELKYLGLTGKGGRIIVPGLGFRNLVRPGGMTLDRAWARAVEAGYINDPGYGSTSEPLQTTNVDLLRLISEGTGGRHTYAVGDEAAAAAIEASRAKQVEQERLAGARSDVQAALKEHGLIATDEQIDRAARLILTDEADPLNAIDHVIERDALADVEEAAQYQPQEQDDGITETFEQRTGTTGGPVTQAVEQQARPRQAQDEAPAQRDQPAQDQRGRGEASAQEVGADNRPQLVIPGAEQIGQGEQAQRAADKPLKPKVAQKPADEGLFGDESKQTDLMDLAQKPPPVAPEIKGLVERIPGDEGVEVLIVKNSDGKRFNVIMRDTDAQETVGPIRIASSLGRARIEARKMLKGPEAKPKPDEPSAQEPQEPQETPQATAAGPSDSKGKVGTRRKTDKGVALASLGRAAEQFLTPRARRDRTKIEAELRRIIKQMTGRDVRVEFSPGSTVATQQRPVGYGSIDKGQQPRALYLPLDRLIKIALGVRDPRSSAYHEAWHDVEFHLLNDNEIGVLRAQTEKLRNVVQKRFGYTDKEIAELAGYEVRAHAFETYARARERGETISGLHTSTRIFEKLRRLFERVRSALNGMGFKTIDDIFAKAFEGEYAGRPDLGTVDVEYLAAMREQREEDAVKFARKQNMGTPEGRKQAMQGYIARGQPLDRAIRLPFDLFGKFNEKGEWKPGAKLSEKAASIIVNAKVSPTSKFSFLNPVLEATRAGLIDRYSLRNHPDYIARERGRSLDERARLLKVEPLIKSMMETVTDTNEAQVLHAILTGEAPPQEAWSKLAEPIRAAIDLIGQEAVELGQVSPESFERNRGTYVHRVYKNREAEQNGLYRMVSNMMGSRRKKIIGSQMKGRGMFHELSVSRLMRDVPGWNEADRGKPQNGEKFIRLDELAEQAEMELGGEPPPPKIQRTIWWPAERPIPDRYSSFKNQGTWEVRGEKGGNPVLWRDFTKAEREKMGEILDARYTVTKSLMLAAHDLATGRFYKDIAENENWSVSQKPSGNVITAGEWREQHLRWKTWKSPDVDWVQVPNDEISNTGGKKKWGALAGKYVREEIWRDLNEIDTLSRPSTWRTLLTFWKGAKTYMSPGVHMNNVMSNVFWFDFADGRLQDFVAGIQSYRTGDKYYQEALENGAFGSDIISQEMRDTVLKPVLEQIMRENTFQQAGGRLGAVGQISKFSSLLWSKVIARGNEFAKSAYQMEDEIFRMGLYLRRRQQGASPREAADDVRRQFIDYDIRAPWVNAARNSVLPFISYTYRAAPLIAHGIATRPWKLFKYMALFTVANALSYALTGGDEEKERKALRDEEQGMTWLLTPRMVRMPFLGGRDGKQPVFLDMRRWIPGGDIFDLTQTHAALPILPSWLTPGGPIMIGAEFLLNHQAFTGQDIVNERTDDLATKAEKTANWAWKALTPNAPWVPNSYGWDNIATTLRGGDNSHTLGTAAASSVGVKLKPLDVEDALTKKQGAIAGEAGAIKREVARLTRLKERGKISENEHRRLTTRLILRATRTQEKAQELSR